MAGITHTFFGVRDAQLWAERFALTVHAVTAHGGKVRVTCHGEHSDVAAARKALRAALKDAVECYACGVSRESVKRYGEPCNYCERLGHGVLEFDRDDDCRTVAV